MKFLALLLIAAPAFPQAISNPGSPTNNPNQINVTTNYLYLQKMHYAGAWSASTTYSSQDVVTYSSSTYVSLQAGNLNITPGTNILYWIALGGGGGGGSATWGGITGTLSNQTDLAASLAALQPLITAGTTSQYYRGDKSFQSLSAAVWSLFSASSPLSYNSSTGAFSCGSCLTSNAVSSVFTRTGAVVAASGDYTAAQVTNAVDQTGSYSNPAWVTGLAWSKITSPPAFPANTGATSHQFFSAYNSATGAFSAAQPAFTDISGSLGHGQLPALLSGDIPNNAANTSGNAATATALAGTPTLCSTGQAPTGVLANGNATGCASSPYGWNTTPSAVSVPSTSLIGNPTAVSGISYALASGVTYAFQCWISTTADGNGGVQAGPIFSGATSAAWWTAYIWAPGLAAYLSTGLTNQYSDLSAHSLGDTRGAGTRQFIFQGSFTSSSTGTFGVNAWEFVSAGSGYSVVAGSQCKLTSQ